MGAPPFTFTSFSCRIATNAARKLQEERGNLQGWVGCVPLTKF